MTLILAGVKLKVKGKEQIPNGKSYLICANHSSYIDIPCLYTIFSHYFVFTGKKEIEKWPLFHIFYTSGMNILIDRNNARNAVVAFKRMGEVLDENHPLFIFPEGTISKTAPEMAEFKSGVVSLAIKKQVPILPVTFTTNWKRLQRSGFWKGKAGPGIAEAIVHPLISTIGMTKEDTHVLQQTLKNTINTPLKRLYKDEVV